MAIPTDPAEMEAYVRELVRAKWDSVPDSGQVYSTPQYADDEKQYQKVFGFDHTTGKRVIRTAEVQLTNFDEAEYTGNSCSRLLLEYEIEVLSEVVHRYSDDTNSKNEFAALLMRGRHAFKSDRSFGHGSREVRHNYLRTFDDITEEIVDGYRCHVAKLRTTIEVFPNA